MGLKATIFFALIAFGHLTTCLGSSRVERQAPNALETAVDGLTTKLDQLTAQVQAQETEISSLRSQIASVDEPVAFTAVFTTPDIEGLQPGQVLKYDRVLYNVGNAYNPATGYFTAPSTGTYAFYNRVMRNYLHEELVQTGIYKENTLLAWADACCHGHDSGSSMVSMHLEEGQTVHVQIHSGTQLWGDHTIFTGFKLSSA